MKAAFRHIRKKQNKGFTTVEWIIVIVLIMILAGGLIFGITRWVEWTQFKRQNEYARTLFVAAQNQLTEYSESGQLEVLRERTGDALVVDVTKLKGKDGEAYQLDEVWPESAGKEGNAFRYRGEVVSLTGTPEDYQAYLSGTADAQTKALYDLFSAYLYDTSILNGAVVCVEFTPDDGQVFAVLYSDKNDDFTYEATEERRGTVSISNRETKYRRDRMVGYYGVDMLSKATSTKAEKPSLSEVKLNNEDTLNLTFHLSKVKEAAQELKYELTVLDKETKNALLRFTLDGSKIGNESFKTAVSCEVLRYQYDETGQPETVNMGEYRIPVWIDQKRTIHIILDAADLDATSVLYGDVYSKITDETAPSHLDVQVNRLKKTLSFHRFGVSAEDIYCTIEGSGEFYKTTAKKQSNSENAFFGSVQSVTDKEDKVSVTYALKNARHLYNMRYLEDYTDGERLDMGYEKNADAVIWQVSENIDWQAFQKRDALFRSGAETVNPDTDFAKAPLTDQAFPSVKQLCADSVLESAEERKVCTISGLKIIAQANAEAGLYNSDSIVQPKKSAGLFLENNGTIQNLTLDRLVVEGEENVGGFCGSDRGELRRLTVKNSDGERGDADRMSSLIRGKENVGGIAGIFTHSEPAGNESGSMTDIYKQPVYEKEYTDLTNYAAVSGSADADASGIGGIIGHIESGFFTSVTVKNCKNYGAVEALTSGSSNIGGIVGCSEETWQLLESLDAEIWNRWEPGDARWKSFFADIFPGIKISDCTSSPQYSEDEISDKAQIEAKLKGARVGGIVGCNKGSDLINCDTQKESSAKEGYIFGGEHVGGIVGYNETEIRLPGAESALPFAQKSKITGGTGTQKGVNAAHVLGKKYVGGIIGLNPGDGEISNWVNRGFVGAVEQYAGGIAGYNGKQSRTDSLEKPLISACTSEVSDSAKIRHLSEMDLFCADFSGGIAGYNDGIIRSESEISLVANVTGTNYVGGVAGYNDVEAEVSNYAVSGGYIRGEGSYIGGFAGFNASRLLLTDRDGKPRYLKSNPNRVTGRSCVGGTIGGTILPSDTDVRAGFLADNFLGELEADGAFAGGFIGYGDLVAADTKKEDIMAALKKSAKALNETKALSEFADPQEKFPSFSKSRAVLTITGRDEAATQAKFGKIKSELYAGGVMGYSSPGIHLVIQNVINKTPVSAKSCIENDKEQPDRLDYNRKAFTYSYAGGIIGKVGANVTLSNCKNQDAGDVTGQGTYTGGLCEVNEGVIQDCAVSSLGSGSTDYVGGITGVNKKSGSIAGSIIKNVTVTGRNYVGGITAENFGTVKESAVEKGSIRTYGTEHVGIAGGIAGVNYKGAAILLSETVRISIDSSAPYVGGIAGINRGTLQNNAAVSVSGSVSGSQYVGGITGTCEGPMRGFYNQASVTAANGIAGGISGEADQAITDCKNAGTVTAQQSGDAGGILARNHAVIASCENYGNVSAQNGVCGGIAGRNEAGAQITDCTVSGGLGEKELVFQSKKKVGGVCGINSGTIAHTSVKRLQISNLSESKNSMMGGIAAENKAGARITDCAVGEASAAVKLVSNAARVDLGGVTGVNRGAVAGRAAGYTDVFASLSFASRDQAYFGNVGGIAGKNEKLISGYAFSGEIEGTGNNPQNAPQYDPNTDFESNGAVIYGYGGIAGINGKADADCAGVIKDCKVSRAKITGTGDANNIANVGGTAGVNGLGAKISGIIFGGDAVYGTGQSGKLVDKNKKASVFVGTEQNTAYGHCGGIAGLNSGSISDIGYSRALLNPDAPDPSDDTSDYSSSADAGSVIVLNYRGHSGGIVGYNRRTGRIQNAATGKNWIVYALQNAQDNGCGGIVGYQAGEAGISYCTNRAIVEKSSAGNGVGGIIGRMECAAGSGYTISHCKNYGDIYAFKRAGGIIGVWKYYGAVVSDCVNYGTVTAAGGEGCGGIVGCLYDIRSFFGTVQMLRCENHGKIVSSQNNCGGMVGFSSQSSVTLQLQKCVNTGLIQGGDNNGGMLGMTANISDASVITDCVNYGYGYNNTNLGGIIPNNLSANLTLKRCFGIADTDYPVAKNAGSRKIENYYLTQEQVDGKDPFYVTEVKAENIQDPGQLYKVVMEADAEGLSDGKRAYFRSADVNGGKESSYIFTFSKTLDLSSLEFYWNRNGAEKRIQNYTVEYKTDAQDTDWTLYRIVNNTDAAQMDAAKEREEIENGSISARQVRIRIARSVKQGTNTQVNACLIRAIFHGTSDGKPYCGYQGTTAGKDASGNYVYSYEPLKKTQNGTTTVFSYTPSDSSASKGVGQKAAAQLLADRMYRLILGEDLQLGISGFALDPLACLKADRTETLTDASLKRTGAAKDNIRYQVYQADHPYFTASRQKDETLSLAVPANLRLDSETGGTLQVTWNAAANADYYQYELCCLDGDGALLTDIRRDVVYGTSCAVSIPDVNGEKVKLVQVRVRAGADVRSAAGTVSSVWSSFSGWETMETSEMLPTPLYHLELVVAGKDKLQYQAVLDNQDAYLSFLKEQGSSNAEEELKNIQIQVSVNNGMKNPTFTFSAADGKSAALYTSTDNNNKVFTGWASAAGYGTSSANSRESQAFTMNAYTKEKMANVILSPTDGKDAADAGFHGATEDTLSYRVKIQKNGSYIFYMRSELTAIDLDLGVPVAVANSALRVSDTTTAYIPSALSPLPADLMNEERYTGLTVRSYPSLLSNNVVYNGHLAASKIAKEDLVSLYVTDDRQISDSPQGCQPLILDAGDGTKKLSSGFVLELTSDGSYNIYYNALLDYNEQYGEPYAKDTPATQMQNQVFYYHLPQQRDVQPTPVIHVNYRAAENASGQSDYDGDPNEDEMCITWDLSQKGYENADGRYNYKEGAVYDYVITGTTAKNQVIQILSGTYTSGTDGENILTLDTRTWNYKHVSVSVNRRGEVDSDGTTKVFPSGAIWESPLKLRLSQITKPNLALHRDADGVVQKNTLVYDITWNNVPDAREQAELGAYEVRAERADTDTAAVRDYQTEDAYLEALETLKTLYGKKSGAAVTETEDSITFVWEESCPQGTVEKTMVLALMQNSPAGTWSIAENLTSVWTFPISKEESGSEQIERQIDLSDYERGELLLVSVRAQAAKDAQNYRDGMDGVSAEMTLPSRLDVPDVNGMTASLRYDANDFITLEQLEQGILLRYQTGAVSDQVQGKYQIAAAIYDSREDADTAKIEHAGDCEDAQGYWNSHALTTLLTKEMPAQMNGNLKDADFVLKNLSPEYAGKWLKIVMRSISDSNISSYWSDEDEDAEKTENYCWIQIPRLQIAAPVLQQGRSVLFYDEAGNYTEQQADTNLQVTQTSLSFAEVAQTDGYQLELVRSPKKDMSLSAQHEYAVSYVDWIYLERSGSGDYYVFYTSSDPAFDARSYQKGETNKTPQSEFHPTAVYLGTLGEEESLMLPQLSEIAEGDADNADPVKTVSYLKLSKTADTRTFLLQLPDVEQVDGSDRTDNAFFTSQVSVQGAVFEKNQACYQESVVGGWCRKADGTASYMEMDDYADAPEQIKDMALSISERADSIYELHAQARNYLVYQVIMLDEAEKPIAQSYVSAYGYGTSDIDTIALLSREIFQDERGVSLRVRIAALQDPKQGSASRQFGLSKWTEWYEFKSLPQDGN